MAKAGFEPTPLPIKEVDNLNYNPNSLEESTQLSLRRNDCLLKAVIDSTNNRKIPNNGVGRN